MAKVDPFTAKRIVRFVEDFRGKQGTLPTLKDLADAGFANGLVDDACRENIIEQFYVTLTNGTIVKGYKPCQPR